MDTKVLASLVAEVIETRGTVKLDTGEQQRFYREFESDVSQRMEEMRAEKRRAYEEAKLVTIR